jgi:hypothetical protein
MSFLVVNKATETFFELETRKLSLLNGEVLSFTGYKLMWRAFDLLILGGDWPREEIVALALRKKNDPTFDATNLLPENPCEVDLPTKREIEILEGPSIDIIQLWSLSGQDQVSGLDACLHDIVASLYQGLEIRPSSNKSS